MISPMPMFHSQEGRSANRCSQAGNQQRQRHRKRRQGLPE